MGWRLIRLTPTDTVAVELRRYRSSEGLACPGPYGYHTAETGVATEPRELTPAGYDRGPDPEKWPRTDPRWPQKCAWCDYRFVEDDPWQVTGETLWKLPDGTTTTLRNAPIGACWTMDWLDEACCPTNRNQPGWPLAVRLPAVLGKVTGVDWYVDGHSLHGSGWNRTGDFTNMTASPSICVPAPVPGQRARYHGWLQNGILTECCEGNTFPGVPRTA